MVRLESICKTYQSGHRRTRVLEDLSLGVSRGDFLAIMGPSGAGKSTLLQVIGLLDAPDSGRYLLDDRDVAGLSESELSALRSQHVGFVFQSSHFVDYLDLVDNVALPGLYAGLQSPRRVARRRATELLAQVGLGHRVEHRPGELSGGERQRAAIARALFNDPGLLLADEPTGNLDEENTVQLTAMLARLNREGITVVLVTHDRVVAETATRRLRLESGRLQEADRCAC